MLEGKAMIQETDMPVKMQLQAMSCASEALDLFDVLDCKSMAAYIKKVWPWMAVCGGFQLWVLLHSQKGHLHLLLLGDTLFPHLQRCCCLSYLTMYITTLESRGAFGSLKSYSILELGDQT